MMSLQSVKNALSTVGSTLSAPVKAYPKATAATALVAATALGLYANGLPALETCATTTIPAGWFSNAISTTVCEATGFGSAVNALVDNKVTIAAGVAITAATAALINPALNFLSRKYDL